MASDDLEATLVRLLTEARELRDVPMPGDEAGPAALHAALVDLRGRQHRFETLLSEAILLRRMTEQGAADARAEADDAWDAQATSRSVGFQHSDAAPRERYARYALATMEQKRAVREAERWERKVAAVLEVLKMFYRGMEATRWALDGRIRAMTLDTRLES